MLGVFPRPPGLRSAPPPPEPPFKPIGLPPGDVLPPPPPPAEVIVVKPVPEIEESEPLVP